MIHELRVGRRYPPGLTVTLLALALFSASVVAEEFALKQDRPSTGTRIRKDLAVWSLPLDKSYEQLTADQKAAFRSAYVNLSEADEPPFPAGGMKDLMRDLGLVQERLMERKPVFAVALIGVDGAVQKVDYYETPSADMARALAVILHQTPFKPARCAGSPCAMEFPLHVMFKRR